MRSKSFLTVLLLFAMALGMGAFVAQAQTLSKPLDVDVPGTNIVFMRIRTSQGDLNPYELRAQIWKRLNEVLAPALLKPGLIDGNSVSVKDSEEGNPQILINDTVIVEVDPVHAAMNGLTQQRLAEIWAGKLSQALDTLLK